MSRGRRSRRFETGRSSEPAQERSTSSTTEDRSLLARLQADVRADADGGLDAPDRRLDPADTSVQVHACHGATRQVEVLREVLVGLMADDPTLEPRDILVMCPDVEAYAPLFSAAFGLGDAAGPDAHPAHRLRVRLADRGLMSTNPLLALAGALVTVAGGRGKASEVLDIAAAEPVRHRFRISDDDLATLTRWVEQSGVRWGLVPQQRHDHQLSGFRQNSWDAGLDRILLGAAMAEDGGRNLAGVLPLDDVGSTQIDLAGRLAELVTRLQTRVERLREATTLEAWLDELHAGVLDLADVPLGRPVAGHPVRARARRDPRGRRRPGHRAAAGRRPHAGRAAHRAAADARQLPHRPPHRLHAGADAVGAPPGGVPGRAGRRGVPARHRHRR